jgi:NADH:ubiquinone oxidoreductase subunit 6 (subunit J)
MKVSTAYACVWLATTLGVIAGLIITKNANCLWALLIPTCIDLNIESKNNDDQDK